MPFHLAFPTLYTLIKAKIFESTVFHQTLKAFGVEKSRTTAYHPEGDGMVERFNRSLLQLLRMYVEKEEDWEKHLPLALYAYRTAVHSSTGVSPFMLMYGREPSSGVLMHLLVMMLAISQEFCSPNYLSYRI